MIDFKGQLEKDLCDVFFNVNEFAEIHSIGIIGKNNVCNPQDYLVIIDRNLKELQKVSYADGTFIGDFMVYVKISDFGTDPRIDSLIKFDGEEHRVTKVIATGGVYCIALVSCHA